MMYKTLSLGAIVAAKRFGCRDEKQWGICLTAYSIGECMDGCDRTCGKCSTDICYDMIPQPHDKFWHDGLSVGSEWPNFANDGGNTLPQKVDDIVNDLYPFNRGAVSEFCQEVFTNHWCDKENLILTYSDPEKGLSHDIELKGSAYEYCRFSCGRCLQTAGCYSTHNNAMQFLARDPDADSDFNNFNFGWGSFNTDSDSDGGWNWDSAESESEPEVEAEIEAEVTASPDMMNDDSAWDWGLDSDEEGEWDFGSFDTDWGFGRKRRGVNLSKEELLKSALKNIVAGLQYHNPKSQARILELVRKRRQTLNQMESNGDRQANFDSINICWGANDANEAAEEVEEVEEEEEAGSLIDQIIERRQDDDVWGITNYFNSKADLEEMELGECTYHPMPASEPSGGMMLYYDCEFRCSGNKIPVAYNPWAETDEEMNRFFEKDEYLKMICSRTPKMTNKKRGQAASICNSQEHPDLKLLCEDSGEEEEAPNMMYDNTAANAEEAAEAADNSYTVEDFYDNYYNYNNMMFVGK